MSKSKYSKTKAAEKEKVNYGQEKHMKKYETCEHAEKIGQTCVWVKATCPKALMVRGNMVSTKVRCEHCKKYKAR